MRLDRLGRRLVLLVAIALAAGIAIPAAALVQTRAERRSAVSDAELGRVALGILLVVPARDDRPGIGVYQQTPRNPGSPLTAVLNRQGLTVASDRNVPAEARKAATARARAGDDDPVTAGELRIVALAVRSGRGRVGAVMAYTSVTALADARRDDILAIGGAALAAWLLLVGATLLMVARTVTPASAAAAREEAFLADAAHELRTPLAVVQARAERALRDGAGDDDLRAIVASTKGAASTIAGMLELARLDSGRAISERVPVQLDALARTCAQERAPGAEVEIVAPERVVAMGDERLLSLAVGNLIDNAVRHAGHVKVTVRNAGEHAEVVVRDDGPGLAPGQRERIFERFHRGPAGGAGLGLPLARRVAEAHGGTVELEQSEGGATFVLRVSSS